MPQNDERRSRRTVDEVSGLQKLEKKRAEGAKLLQGLLRTALSDAGTNAELARRLRVNPITVARWIEGRDRPNEGGCLRLARLTRTPAPLVFEWAGYDPEDVRNLDAIGRKKPKQDGEDELAEQVRKTTAKQVEFREHLEALARLAGVGEVSGKDKMPFRSAVFAR